MRLCLMVICGILFSCSKNDTVKMVKKKAPVLSTLTKKNLSTLGFECHQNKKETLEIKFPEIIKDIALVGNFFNGFANNKNIHFQIKFRRPLLPPLTTSLDEKRTELLKYFSIDPAVNGEFSFYDNSTVVFIPSDTLPFATRFIVTIGKGLKDIDGRRLKKDFSWQFNTKLPDITIESSRKVNYPCRLDETFEIKSNIELNLNTLKRCTRIVEEGTDRYIPFELFEHENNVNERDNSYYISFRYILKPELLQKNKRYKIIILSGVRTIRGNIPTENKYTLRIKTYSDFEFIGIDQTPYNPSDTHFFYTPLLIFSSPLQLDQYHKSNPEISLSLKGKDDTLVSKLFSYGNNRVDTFFYYYCSKITKGSSNYQIRLSPELTDQMGQKISNPGYYKFSTPSHRPFLLSPVGYRIVSSVKTPVLQIKHSNIDGVYYKIDKMKEADLFMMWKTKIARSPESFRYFDNMYKLINDNDTLIEYKRLKKNRSSIDSSFFDLKKYLNYGKYGTLVYEFFSPDVQYSSDDKIKEFSGMMQYSNIGMHVQIYPTSGIVKLNQLTDNEPVSDAQVEIYKWADIIYTDTGYIWDLDKPVTKGFTDKDGIFYYSMNEEEDVKKVYTREFHFRNRKELEYLVVAKKNGDMAYCFANDDFNKFTDVFWEGDGRRYAALFSDQQLYSPGDTIKLKGIVRYFRYGKIHMPAKDESIELDIDSDNKIKIDSNEFGDFGTFKCEIPTDHKWKCGEYNVYVYVSLNGFKADVAFYSFEIAEFRVPEFNVSFLNNQNIIVSNSKFDLVYSGKYYDGIPLSGAKSKLTVKKYKTNYIPKGWDNYQFQYSDYRKLADSSAKTITLNNDGMAIVPIDIKNDFAAKYNFDVEILGLNGQASAAHKSIIVLPNDTLIGVALEQKKQTGGDSVYLSVIVTNPGGTPMKGVPVEITFSQQVHKKKDVNITGLYRKKVISDTAAVKIGYFCEYGRYTVEARKSESQDSTLCATKVFWVFEDPYPP